MRTKTLKTSKWCFPFLLFFWVPLLTNSFVLKIIDKNNVSNKFFFFLVQNKLIQKQFLGIFPHKPLIFYWFWHLTAYILTKKTICIATTIINKMKNIRQKSYLLIEVIVYTWGYNKKKKKKRDKEGLQIFLHKEKKKKRGNVLTKWSYQYIIY